MALVSVLGQEIYNVALVPALLFQPVFARLVRTEVLSLVERPFVVAARCSGATDLDIIFRHIMPNAVAPAIISSRGQIGPAKSSLTNCYQSAFLHALKGSDI